MSSKPNHFDRRNFLKTIGAVGVGAVLSGKVNAATVDPNSSTGAEQANPQVPRRVLGKTGVEVPILSLGCIFNVLDKQIVLRKSMQWGVNYWDTAYGYENGNSELGIGKFLEKNPEARKNIFIVSKASGAGKPEEIEARLQESLKRMNTSYVDLYYGVHGLSNPETELSDNLKKWAEDAKKRKVIKFFGFSTHSNMAKCMMAASKCDWIDAIMPSYNFRLMQQSDFKEASQACYEAKIGLVAMKVMGQKIETDGDKGMTDYFVKKGFTEGQAKLKVVLEDKKIASACIGRDNLTHLSLNIAAALDKTQLAKEDVEFLNYHASQTCGGYCAGCTDICDAAMGTKSYVGDVMRSLMYANSYGEFASGKDTFAQIPSDIRERLLNSDLAMAEKACPNRLPIARLVRQAAEKFA